MSEQALVLTEAHTLVQSGEPGPLQSNPAVVYLAGLAGGRTAMEVALENIAELLTGERDVRWVRWAKLRFQHTNAIRAKLIEVGYAAATVRLHLSAIRGVLKAAWRLEQISGEHYRRAADLDPVRGERELAGRMLAPQELAALLEVCTDDPRASGPRDGAMIGLMAATGLRRGEVSALDVSDYDAATGAVHVRHGKGNKERTVYIANSVQRALDDWVRVRGTQPGPLFVSINRAGRIKLGNRLHPTSIYHALGRRADDAGVKHVTPHDLRRTAISNLIDETDLATAARIAGHDDPMTTARYDRRGERTKREAADKIDIPYAGAR